MKLEGHLREVDFPGVLVELWRERFTGAVRLENDSIIKIVYFKNGDLLSASTNDRTDSIGEILLRHDKVSREHLKQALSKRKDTESLGDSLLGLGFITRKELTWARRAQLVGAMRSVLAWNDAEFSVIPDYVPKREEGTSFEFPQVFLEVLLTGTEREVVDAELRQGELVLSRTPEFEPLYRTLNLNEEADEVAELVDGVRTAAAIASEARADRFNVYKLLVALRHLGLVQAPPDPEPEPAIAQPMEELPSSFDETPLLPPPLSDDEERTGAELMNEEQPRRRSGRGVMLILALAVLLLLAAAYIIGAGKLLDKTPQAEVANPSPRPSPTALVTETAVPTIIVAPPAGESAATSDYSWPAQPPPMTPTPAPTPAPAQVATETTTEPVPAADPVRARYDQMAGDYARSIAPGTYTVQFGIFCRTESITRALRDHAANVWFVPTSFRGENCFRAYWGRYQDRAAAEAAMQNLPGALREGAKPAVVSPRAAN